MYLEGYFCLYVHILKQRAWLQKGRGGRKIAAQATLKIIVIISGQFLWISFYDACYKAMQLVV